MGEWMTIPGAEEAIAARINRFRLPRRRERHYSKIAVEYDLLVFCPGRDTANLNDVGEAPLWECEMPWPDTDDGF